MYSGNRSGENIGISPANYLQVAIDGTTVLGLEPGDLFAGADSRLTLLQTLTTTPYQLPSNYIGMHFKDQNAPTNVVFGTLRLHDCDCSWQDIDPNAQGPSGYDAGAVARLDALVGLAHSKSADIIYCFNGTPAGFAVDGNIRQRSVYELPLQNFLAWLWDRYGTKITAIEPWNEPNTPGYFAGTYSGAGNDLWLHSSRIYDWVKYFSRPWTVLTPSFTDASGAVSMNTYMQDGGNDKCDAFAFHAYQGSEFLKFDRKNTDAFLAVAASRSPGKDIWCTEVGNSNPTRRSIVEPVLYMSAKGVKRVCLYAWDHEGKIDMRISRLGAGTWNSIVAELRSGSISRVSTIGMMIGAVIGGVNVSA